MSRFRKLASKWLLGSSISLIAMLAAYLLSVIPTFESLELKSYDLRFRLCGAQATDDLGIAIVAIDEASFLDLPTVWPFPRHYYAKLIDNLTMAGARLIVFDLLFAEPSANARDDFLLAQAARQSGRVVFAGKQQTEQSSKFKLLSAPPLAPLAALAPNSRDWALVDVSEDVDGFVRRYSPYYDLSGRKYLTLAARSLITTQKGAAELDHAAGEGGLQLRGLNLPAGSFLINYRGPARSFPTYSLSSVLDDPSFQLADGLDLDSFTERLLPEGVFKDKIVFVGAAAEELQDVKLTPFFAFAGEKLKMPGVEVHANAMSTMLRGDYIHTIPTNAELFLLLLAAVVTMILARSGGVVFGVVATALELLLLFVIAVVAFNVSQLWLPVVSPFLAVVLSYGGNSAHTIVAERRERKRTRRVFEQYVSESIVKSILASGREPEFGGHKQVLTVLFSDIRSFTTYCEKHTPEVVVNRLNEYLSAMVDIIFKNDGTLDKFVGDEIMALYGAPYHYREHAQKACITACEMIASLRSLQKRWAASAQDYFQIGIGINTGTMIVGNLGAQQRFDYTAIGDEVNLGARLEGANKQYGTAIIISESTMRHVKGIARVRELDLVRVKGKQRPVRIYELRGMAPLPAIEEDLIIAVYSSGLQHYQNRDWLRALQEFKRVLRYFPTDGATRVYIARCLQFIESPPPVDWDGVYEFTVK